MNAQKDVDLDEASIKPVSSLRSHFEQLGKKPAQASGLRQVDRVSRIVPSLADRSRSQASDGNNQCQSSKGIITESQNVQNGQNGQNWEWKPPRDQQSSRSRHDAEAFGPTSTSIPTILNPQLKSPLTVSRPEASTTSAVTKGPQVPTLAARLNGPASQTRSPASGHLVRSTTHEVQKAAKEPPSRATTWSSGSSLDEVAEKSDIIIRASQRLDEKAVIAAKKDTEVIQVPPMLVKPRFVLDHISAVDARKPDQHDEDNLQQEQGPFGGSQSSSSEASVALIDTENRAPSPFDDEHETSSPIEHRANRPTTVKPNSSVPEESRLRPALPPRRKKSSTATNIIDVAPSTATNHSSSVTQSSQPSLHRLQDRGPILVQDVQSSALGSAQTSLTSTRSRDDAPILSVPEMTAPSRRSPHFPFGARVLDAGRDMRSATLLENYLCIFGGSFTIFALDQGQLLFSTDPDDQEYEFTAASFQCRAGDSHDIPPHLWLGTADGLISIFDVRTRRMIDSARRPHGRRRISHILHCANHMCSLDDAGTLLIWSNDERNVPTLEHILATYQVIARPACSLESGGTLWFASGKKILGYRPFPREGESFEILRTPFAQDQLGSVAALAMNQVVPRLLFSGHNDGKVSVYDTESQCCLYIVHCNVYRISSMLCVGSELWIAYSIGSLCIYDTTVEPWRTTKIWTPHPQAATQELLLDRTSMYDGEMYRVASIGSDHTIRFWEGESERDWIDRNLQENDQEFCQSNELSACVVTWNAGATTPDDLSRDDGSFGFFANLVQGYQEPDLLIFGFQELVDLEDKKLTAKMFFKGNARKEYDNMHSVYRAWRDYLASTIRKNASTEYQIIHSTDLVGLFSCVFIKASQMHRVSDISVAELKRGMGGLHGNKGALYIRFFVDDTSICLINCHLAAGQTQVSNRNNDVAAILETEVLPKFAKQNDVRCISGGDGSMSFDHDVCILNGDLNYRIDTMGKSTVVKAIEQDSLARALERDQLSVSLRRNPMFRLRSFRELPITFAPTYKYDVGSDRYDTSEKNRVPAWCDRILCYGAGKVQQLDYQRHELRASDHRPVSARFNIRVNQIIPAEVDAAVARSRQRFQHHRAQQQDQG